jgi:superfamily II RNA helicase
MINDIIKKDLRRDNLKKIWFVVNRWANGCKFQELMQMANYQEGDFIRFFRQITDCMSQIKNATDDYELQDKIVKCMNLVYRDVVKFEF